VAVCDVTVIVTRQRTNAICTVRRDVTVTVTSDRLANRVSVNMTVNIESDEKILVKILAL